jgi:hypothetical protein
MPDYKCPEKDIEKGCKGPKDCHYSHPSNCSSFVHCDSYGNAYRMPCPSDLEWNDEDKECVDPKKSTCQSNRVLTTNEPMTTLKPKPSTSPQLVTPAEGFTCSKASIAATGCKGEGNCLYPNPEDCTTFIQCVPQSDGTLKPLVMESFSRLLWNSQVKICECPPSPACSQAFPSDPSSTRSVYFIYRNRFGALNKDWPKKAPTIH